MLVRAKNDKKENLKSLPFKPSYSPRKKKMKNIENSVKGLFFLSLIALKAGRTILDFYYYDYYDYDYDYALILQCKNNLEHPVKTLSTAPQI